MLYLLLTALAILLLCLSVTETLPCEPNTRYGHPLDCSMFIICDQNWKANTFHCPTGLHFNANESHCDWPASARCALGNYTDAAVKTLSSNATAAGKGSVFSLISAGPSILNKLHGNDGNDSNTNKSKDESTQTGKPEKEISGVKPMLNVSNSTKLFEEGVHQESEKKHDGITQETTTTEDDLKIYGEEKVNVYNNGSDGSTTSKLEGNKDNFATKTEENHTQEIVTAPANTTQNVSVETKSGPSDKKVHSISKRQGKTDTKIETLIEEAKKENKELIGNNKDKIIYEITEIQNASSDEDLISDGLEGKEEHTTPSVDDLVTDTSITEDTTSWDDTPEKAIINNTGSNEFVVVSLNLTMEDNKNLGY